MPDHINIPDRNLARKTSYGSKMLFECATEPTFCFNTQFSVRAWVVPAMHIRQNA